MTVDKIGKTQTRKENGDEKKLKRVRRKAEKNYGVPKRAPNSARPWLQYTVLALCKIIMTQSYKPQRKDRDTASLMVKM